MIPIIPEPPMDNINIEFPFPLPPNPIKTMRGPIVPVNEKLTAYVVMPPRPNFPNVQKQIGGGISPPSSDMIFNITEEEMIFNNSGESMEYNS